MVATGLCATLLATMAGSSRSKAQARRKAMLFGWPCSARHCGGRGADYLGSSIHFDGPGFGRGLFFVGVLARPGETLFTFRNKWGQVGADGKLLRFH